MNLEEFHWKIIAAVVRCCVWCAYLGWVMLVMFFWWKIMSRSTNGMQEITTTAVAILCLVAGYTSVKGIDSITRW